MKTYILKMQSGHEINQIEVIARVIETKDNH